MVMFVVPFFMRHFLRYGIAIVFPLDKCPHGPPLCTATHLLRVLFVNKCSCMLYLDPGLRFAQPRLKCLQEQLSISHKSYLLHNHSNSVKISECWFIRGQFNFISTQAWPSDPAEQDAHYS